MVTNYEAKYTDWKYRKQGDLGHAMPTANEHARKLSTLNTTNVLKRYEIMEFHPSPSPSTRQHKKAKAVRSTPLDGKVKVVGLLTRVPNGAYIYVQDTCYGRNGAPLFFPRLLSPCGTLYVPSEAKI